MHALMRKNWLETARHRKVIGDVDGVRDAVATARYAHRKLMLGKLLVRASRLSRLQA
jgi:hypothetical protein